MTGDGTNIKHPFSVSHKTAWVHKMIGQNTNSKNAVTARMKSTQFKDEDGNKFEKEVTR